MHTKRPPRLEGFDYIGFYRYFLTVCTHARERYFADPMSGHRLIDQFLQCGGRFGLEIAAYCLMPDHLHALVHATRPDGNFRHFVRIWKQKSSFEWKQRTGSLLWQEGYYERVLRDEDGDLHVIAYIASNAVAAGLVESPEQYPLFGSTKFTMQEILQALAELEPWRR